MNPIRPLRHSRSLEIEDFTGVDPKFFRSQTRVGEVFPEEFMLSLELDQALVEEDIILLRSTLKNIANQTGIKSGNAHSIENVAYFGLSEEVFKPTNLDVDGLEPEIGNYLQKLHLKNHVLSSKEVVHDLFSRQEETVGIDWQEFSPEDELLFEEIQDALTEKEIVDLRANLKSIAQSVTIHERTFEEIEEFISGELDAEIGNLIREESMVNAKLSNEIYLNREINEAIEEFDVIQLRNGIKELIRSEYSHSQSFEDLDDYLNSELEEQALSLFEEELLSNSGLSDDVAFNREVNLAIAEDDVMALRAQLSNIVIEEQKRDTEILGINTSKSRRIYWYAVASTVGMILLFTSLIRNQNYSTDQLYASYYQPYKGGSNVSRSYVGTVSEVNRAISKIEHKDFSAALKLLGEVPDQEQDGFSVNFYKGIAYQELGEFRSAIKSFNEVIRHGDNLLVEQSEWYIGLCYLRIEEREKAARQFRSIVARKGFYKAQSSKLLRQLE
jgi:tetratricopeptide (TPR) repeat protein